MGKISLAIFMFICLTTFGQEKTVSGVVTDSIGLIPGANVVIKGTNRGTQTDFEGKYSIKAKVGEILIFSFITYDNQQITVGGANTYNIKLRQSKIQLQEEVPYYPSFKRKSPVAQAVKVEDLEKQQKSLKRKLRKEKKAAKKVKDSITNR